MLNVVIFGPPGAGKGTQSDKIMSHFELTHLSTGNLLREQIAAGTPLGLQAQSIMESGQYVSDSIVIGMIEDKLNHITDSKGFIFDGFPRTVVQAQILDELLNKRNNSITIVIFLDVPVDELIDRLLKRAEIEGRKDDNVDTIRTRLETYTNQTLPVADYYQKQNKLHRIEGTGSVEDIFERIRHSIQ